MPIRRVNPTEAKRLVDDEGFVYVDVRSIPEFEGGHPEGAYNVPIAHLGPHGMAANDAFISVMQSTFPKDAKLVVGCKGGGRSLQAASLLLSLGFANVIDQMGGFDGHPGNAGWRSAGLPTATQPRDGRGYEALSKKK